ncbi:MAG: hypothetical protein ACKPH7_15335, partial [Planktothrix sp.]
VKTMRKKIDIVELRGIPLSETEQLLGWNVDAPAVGTQSDAANVEFRGWVVGKTSPVIAVEVVAQGRIVLFLTEGYPSILQYQFFFSLSLLLGF